MNEAPDRPPLYECNPAPRNARREDIDFHFQRIEKTGYRNIDDVSAKRGRTIRRQNTVCLDYIRYAASGDLRIVQISGFENRQKQPFSSPYFRRNVFFRYFSSVTEARPTRA